MHLQIDGKVSRILNYEESFSSIKDLIDLVEMTAVGEFVYTDTYLGPSGYQLIMESHIAFDYIEDYLCFDIFSCKNFLIDKTIEFVTRVFCYQEDFAVNVMDRGFH